MAIIAQSFITEKKNWFSDYDEKLQKLLDKQIKKVCAIKQKLLRII